MSFKNLFKKRTFTQVEKNRYALIGGVSGLVLGFWMIFFTSSRFFGFVPAIMGAILLIWGKKW